MFFCWIDENKENDAGKLPNKKPLTIGWYEPLSPIADSYSRTYIFNRHQEAALCFTFSYLPVGEY